MDGLLGFDLEGKKAIIIDSGDKKFATSSRNFVAQALFNLLSDDSAIEEAKNQYIHVSGIPKLSQNDILDILKKHHPGDWQVERMNTQDVLTSADQDIRNGDFWGVGKLVQVYTFSDELGVGDFSDTKLWNTRLGLKDENADEMIQEVLKGSFNIKNFPPRQIPKTLLPEAIAAA
jgi:hypothetical protein